MLTPEKKAPKEESQISDGIVSRKSNTADEF